MGWDDGHNQGRSSFLECFLKAVPFVVVNEKLPVKKKRRAEIDRAILASVKREMERPRLTASVRLALEAEAALAEEKHSRDLP
jgi:hypothetical protein